MGGWCCVWSAGNMSFYVFRMFVALCMLFLVCLCFRNCVFPFALCFVVILARTASFVLVLDCVGWSGVVLD